MTKSNSILLIVAGVLGLAAVAGTLLLPHWRGSELGQKERWSLVQRAEYDYRDSKNVHEPIVLRDAFGSKYTLLGMPTRDARYPIAWIIIGGPDLDDSLIVLPNDVPFIIDCAFIDRLRAQTVNVTPTAERHLRSKCVQNSAAA